MPYAAGGEATLDNIEIRRRSRWFRPCCAAEELDSGAVRLHKIEALIRECMYGIHDLSRVELGPVTRLPRFNMPFELGLDLAARAFGAGRLKGKQFLVLDAKRYRYQQFISDISGQDIQGHQGVPDEAIDKVRNWLRGVSRRSRVAGPVAIKRSFRRFARWLPRMCADRGLERDNLPVVDFVEMAEDWIARAEDLRRTCVRSRRDR